ncbi:hypothetical protein C2G38_2031388 [Gigaspora rosea]|uniref:Peptidase S1 domain-containing protein n=1 Tax=Gigaspora rosea TaxID=44941 RepID=A0A397W139_9GLOM|nr:hypothetical protein C2G38_2031388 [Gigaspora rosea]
MPTLERKYDIINHTVSVADVDQVQAFPIGMLFLPDGSTCTASVINTPESRTIGLTAAHCLYDNENHENFDNIMFSPGYDHRQQGPLNLIPVDEVIVPDEFINNNDDLFDWGFMRFTFNMNGHPLQDFTGALGWRFNVGEGVETTIRGYSEGGNLEDCPNDGETLCTWDGEVFMHEFYFVPALDLGEGASGSPYIMLYDPDTNLGWLYSTYIAYDDINDHANGPIYDPIQFQGLLGEIIGF